MSTNGVCLGALYIQVYIVYSFWTITYTACSRPVHELIISLSARNLQSNKGTRTAPDTIRSGILVQATCKHSIMWVTLFV